jgi:hypothetical protein
MAIEGDPSSQAHIKNNFCQRIYGMNVSGEEAKRRLNYIRVHLLRAMFGNNFRRAVAENTKPHKAHAP